MMYMASNVRNMTQEMYTYHNPETRSGFCPHYQSCKSHVLVRGATLFITVSSVPLGSAVFLVNFA